MATNEKIVKEPLFHVVKRANMPVWKRLLIYAIAIIVAVLMNPSNPDGGRNVITGTNDSYYAQNKGSTKEGRLKKLIIICSIAILVLTIAFYVIEHFFAG